MKNLTLYEFVDFMAYNLMVLIYEPLYANQIYNIPKKRVHNIIL